MQRFYFDVRDGSVLHIDEEGQELGDMDAVEQEASEALAIIARDLLPKRRNGLLVIEVSDESRLHLLSLSIEMRLVRIQV
jgi:hypothetical protein